jgi:hypothetical protein
MTVGRLARTSRPELFDFLTEPKSAPAAKSVGR